MDTPDHLALVLPTGMPDPDTVRALEAATLQVPQIALPTDMLIHGRMCARTIFIPAGTLLTGALTNLDNICVVCGDIEVTTDAGPQRLTGYHVLPANRGGKRVGLAHADTYWTTFIHTDLTDPVEVENAMTDEADALQTRRAGIEWAQASALEGKA